MMGDFGAFEQKASKFCNDIIQKCDVKVSSRC